MLIDLDWRLQGGLPGVSDDGTELTVVLVDEIPFRESAPLAFPVPNATAMMLNASQRAFASANALSNSEALNGAPQGFHSFASNADAVDFAEHMSVATISAYTALECFANETFAPWLLYKQPARGSREARELNKEEYERFVSLGEKLGKVLPEVFGVPSPKGTKLWDSFLKLERARNRIIHMKEADRESSNAETDTVWKALFAIGTPHQLSKELLDHFFMSRPHVPHLKYDNYLPVRPKWHVSYPLD